MSVQIKPLGDRVLVEAAEEKEVQKGGIIIPDSAKEKPSKGKADGKRCRCLGHWQKRF